MTATTNLADMKRASQMTASQAGSGTVRKFFESQKSAITQVLPKHMDAERLLRIATSALRTTPKLLNAKIETLFGAVVQCAQLGLEPNTPLGHAYLIPFDNRQKGITEVQVVFGYKGLIDLARRSGQIVSIAAHEVCEKDHFEFSYGLDEKLDHKPALGNRGEVIAFYAVAKLVGGGYAFEVMSREQVEEIRNNSQNYKFASDKRKTVWGQHPVEMGRKTVLRRLFKYLPVSIELATASAMDGAADAGVSQSLDDVLTGEYTVVDTEAPGRQFDEQPQEQAAPQPRQQAPRNEPAPQQADESAAEFFGGDDEFAAQAAAAEQQAPAPTGRRARIVE